MTGVKKEAEGVVVIEDIQENIVGGAKIILYIKPQDKIFARSYVLNAWSIWEYI